MTAHGVPALPDNHPLITAYFRAHRKMPAPTVVSHRSTLNRLCVFLASQAHGRDLVTARTDDLEDFLDAIMAGTCPFSDGAPGNGKKRSPNTANACRVVLRKFYAWAFAERKLGRRKANPALAVGARDKWNTEPHVVTDVEFAAMMRACGNDGFGKRNRAILRVLRHMGLRRGEIAGLDLTSYVYGDDVSYLTVGTATHRTKTRRQRVVPVHPLAVDALETYLSVRGEEDGPLFVSTVADDQRLTPSGVGQIVGTVAKRAGIKRRVGVHEFRRAWAIGLKREGVSSEAIMVGAGWDDATMVMRYTRSAKVELAHAELTKAYRSSAAPKPKRPNLRAV